MTLPLLFLAFFALMASAFAFVVASRPPRSASHGALAVALVLFFFAVLGWALVHFLFAELAAARL